MNWNEMKDKIFQALEEIPVDNQDDLLLKTNIMFYIYKSLESEEIFNKNCNILNKAYLEEKNGVLKK
jgi:hypothetical protein